MKQQDPKHCEHCGNEFTPNIHNGKYCGIVCQRRVAYEKQLEKNAEAAARKNAQRRINASLRRPVIDDWLQKPWTGG